jgi:hypothetical protein
MFVRLATRNRVVVRDKAIWALICNACDGKILFTGKNSDVSSAYRYDFPLYTDSLRSSM